MFIVVVVVAISYYSVAENLRSQNMGYMSMAIDAELAQISLFAC